MGHFVLLLFVATAKRESIEKWVEPEVKLYKYWKDAVEGKEEIELGHFLCGTQKIKIQNNFSVKENKFESLYSFPVL